MAKVYVSVNHGSSLLKELHQQFKEGKNCDLEIRLNTKRLYVHKCLIDIYFMKVGAEIEDDRFYIDLTDYSQQVVESLVGFMYTGSLCCPLDKKRKNLPIPRTQIEKVYVAAAELGCVDAQKGCQLYLQSIGVLPVSSSNDSVSYLEKRTSELVTSTSNSETESLDASEEPPKVKIEVVDDTYEYQSTDSSNFASENAENLDTRPKVLDYSSTASIPPLPVSSNDTYSTTGTDKPLSYSSMLDTLQTASNVQPKTIAVPVGMHSTPDDFKEVQKRSGRTTIVNDPDDLTITTSYPTTYPTTTKRKAEYKTLPEAPRHKRGRKCKQQGTVVEIVYPKQPVVQPGMSQSKAIASMLKGNYSKDSVSLLGRQNAGSEVKGGLRSLLLPGKNVKPETQTHPSTSTNLTTSKPAASTKKHGKHVEKYKVDVPVSSNSGDSDKAKVSTPVSSCSNSDNDSNLTEVIVKTEPVDADDETEPDRDLESEKNEQMLFLGLTKTIDEDKRRLEEEAAQKKNTRRLRARKKVDYSKTDSVDLYEFDDIEMPVSTKVKKQKMTTSTAVGDSDNVNSKDGKRAYAATVAVKTGQDSNYVNEMYFPPAGTVPEGTRSRYAQGSFMRAKFVTESIEDKDGNVTVVSKRVPVRPRQFGMDERLKNRPAVYICHPTAPVVNTNTRAPKQYQMTQKYI